jgi:hypothetical protein
MISIKVLAEHKGPLLSCCDIDYDSNGLQSTFMSGPEMEGQMT